MKNIHLIPTDKEQHSIIQKHTGLLLKQTKQKHFSGNKFNLFITSDEEITGFENYIWVYNNGRVWLWQNTMALRSDNKPRKIILTTDQDLIKDGVQAIDDEFLEWFVKNPSCEEVEVEQEMFKLVHNPNYVNHTPDGDGIYLTPKSEDLQYGETLIEDNVIDYKIIIPKEEPKQETTADYIDRHIVQAMVEVAKQKMYSEEEVINIIYKIYDEMGISISLEDVLKQFKK